MFKKLSISLFIVLVAASLITGAALAAGSQGNRFGKVTSISSNRFTFQNFDGVTKTILVTSDTKFRGVNGLLKNFSDLKVGQWINAVGSITTNRDLSAHTVVLVSNFVSSDWNGPRINGQVTAVNVSANTFTMSTYYGSNTFHVNSSTHYLSSNVPNLSSLKVGMDIFVGYSGNVAKGIIAYTPHS
jgi:hypothetical protein